MTKNEFGELMKKINAAFPFQRHAIDKDVLDVWYDMLGGYEKKYLDKAITKYIFNNDNPPTIHVLNEMAYKFERSAIRTKEKVEDIVEAYERKNNRKANCTIDDLKKIYDVVSKSELDFDMVKYYIEYKASDEGIHETIANIIEAEKNRLKSYIDNIYLEQK